MKKLLFLIMIFIPLSSYAGFTIKHTGFYGVRIRSMPFWRFWNVPKSLQFIATYAKSTHAQVQAAIDIKIPVYFTWNEYQAEELRDELIKLGCEVEIKELAFTFSDEQSFNEEQSFPVLPQPGRKSQKAPDISA